MHTLALYFVDFVLKNSSTEQYFTCVAKQEHDIQYLIEETLPDFSFSSLVLTTSGKRKYFVYQEQDPVFYQLCQDLLQQNMFIKYDQLMPFDSDINSFSFKKHVLLKNNSYKAQTELESFLEKHNILKAYYYKQIDFNIRTINNEFSRSHGDREFSTQHQTKCINTNIINGLVARRHSGAVYSSKIRQELISMSGVNDIGQSFDHKF